MLAARVHDEPGDLGETVAEWDALAVRSERPFSAPAWALSWWESLRPGGTEMRLVVVRDGGRLVGVVPLCCAKRSYAPLGGGMAPVEPLAEPGLEAAVADAALMALAETSPLPATLEIEAHGSSPEWAGLLGRAWGGGREAPQWTRSEFPVPQVDLGEGFDAWLEAKSSSFRREVKRKRRKLEEAGGSFRFANADSLAGDVEVFMRLHRRRLAGQGGSSLGDERVEHMLVSVGEKLLDCGRFRLLCLDLDGEPIAAQLLLAAGSEVSAWNSGFEQAHAKLSPSMQCIVEALADASRRGERTMSLGPGGQDYKYRLASGEDTLRAAVLVRPGAGHRLRQLRLVPARLRKGLSGSLSPATKRRLRSLVHRSGQAR